MACEPARVCGAPAVACRLGSETDRAHHPAVRCRALPRPEQERYGQRRLPEKRSDGQRCSSDDLLIFTNLGKSPGLPARGAVPTGLLAYSVCTGGRLNAVGRWMRLGSMFQAGRLSPSS